MMSIQPVITGFAQINPALPPLTALSLAQGRIDAYGCRLRLYILPAPIKDAAVR